MRLDAAPQGSLGGHHNGIGIDLESRNAKPDEMRGPGSLIGEDPVGMFGKLAITGPERARWRI
jgi:hypothetical protein